MIKVSDLCRSYGDFKAVDHVSATIERGEVVGLLGHNGAGKSTIMKMMTGFLEPTAGTISIDGLQIGKDTPSIQQRIGYLPENCPVWPEMNVMEYLQYQGRLHGVEEDALNHAVATTIRRTELKEKASQSIQTLSRGYRQRVGVAQAILHNPDIIILDEPTNGLDPTQIRHMRSLIAELAEHATVIISTHILQEVQAVCERVLILRAGKLVVDSTLDALQSGHTLLIQLDNPKAMGYLGQIDGVASVTPRTDSEHHGYALTAAANIAPDVATAVHNHGDKLYAMQPELRDLETVFAEVNAADANVDAMNSQEVHV